MAQDSLFDTQSGLYAVLTGASSVTTLLAAGADSIVDHVPQGSDFPYVVLGDMSSRPLETQDTGGNDIVATFYVYSQGKGFKETKDIMAALDAALHNQSFSIPNQTLILCQRLDSAVGLESDGITRRAVMRYRIITEPSA